MTLTLTRANSGALRRLPTSVRTVVNAEDIEVPEGYEIEPVLIGLSFPCGMGFAPDGSLFLLEGGSTWPTRPYMPARILRFHTDSGHLEELAEPAFRIAAQKTKDQLLIQEYMLEMGPVAILYHEDA